MATDDPGRHTDRYQRALANLQNADIADVDRQAIEGFLNARSGEDTMASLANYASVLRTASERCHRPLLALDGPDDAKRFWTDLRTNPAYGRSGTMSTSTVGTYMMYVRMLLEHHNRDWATEIEPDEPDDDEAAVNPRDMLDEDDIGALIDAADRQRDIALIEFLADTGARLGLVVSLRNRDVALDGDRATYTPNPEAIGLKGAESKPYPIIDARAALRTYRTQSHPRPDEPEAAFFHSFHPYFDSIDGDDGSMTPQNIRTRLKRISRTADVDKPVNPHNFKHSAVTRMAREGYTREQIRHRVHWSEDTDMFDIYVHLDAEKVNDDIFAAAGVIDEAEGAKRMRGRCGTCNAEIAPHHEHCPQCGAPASLPRSALIDAVEDLLIDAIVEADTMGLRRDLQHVLEGIRADPSRVPDVARNLFPEEIDERHL